MDKLVRNKTIIGLKWTCSEFVLIEKSVRNKTIIGLKSAKLYKQLFIYWLEIRL